jgi:hypothetical protein
MTVTQERANSAQGGYLEGAPSYGELFHEVDESKVVRLAGASASDIGAAAVSGMWAYRWDAGNWHGQLNYTLSWPGIITPSSLVFVAAGEGQAGGPGAGKFVGNARYTVHNVAPANGFVVARINVEWNGPIRVYVDYLVVNA